MFRRGNGDDYLKVVTAIGNPIINNKLREYNEYEVIGKDIQYEEGIFELLEQISSVDIIIISNALPEEYDFKIFINKILNLKSNIKLIVFLKEKNQGIENYLNSKNIFDIFYLNRIEDFFYNINKKNSSTNSLNDVDEFKTLLLESIHNSNDNKKNMKINTKGKGYIKSYSKILTITGNNGSGKSIFSTIFSNLLLNLNKRVLLIDCSYSNSTISYLLEINNKKNNNDLIININDRLSVICELDKLIFNQKNNNGYLYNELEILKKEYDYIIIDLPGNIKNDLVIEFLKYSNNIIYLFEPNLIEMQKANIFLESFINDVEININKIKLVLNKTNKYKISSNIIESVFSDFKIIGDIEYNERFNYVINKSVINELPKKDFEKIFENINAQD